MSRDLLYEIGVEEIPASYIDPALAALRAGVLARLEEERVDHGAVSSLATPRRFTLIVRELAERQRDLERTALGPAAGVAFDAGGQPTKAALGFARGQGVAVEELERTTTDKGEYVMARVRRPGLATADVLPAVLAAATRAMPFPRTMCWKPGADLRFARPIRWLVALLGDEVLGVELDGIVAGRETRGPRFHAHGPFSVHGIDDYLRVLADNGVVLDPVERRREIAAALESAAGTVGGRVVDDPELLAEVTHLVSSPSVIAGTFDASFLELPRDVVTTAMRAHQRYFAVEEKGGTGRLKNCFLCVVNGRLAGADGGSPAGGLDPARVRDGHEWVLDARLADARFYWERDVARGVTDRGAELAGVVWQEGLGTLADKTERLIEIAVAIARAWDPELVPVVRRAALLAKADQVSEMVRDGKEFTGLQGRIGAEYARVAGESPAVCAAIAEQYLPRGADDQLPGSPAGQVLAIADKLDHVVGAFVAGKIPRGSEDPFAVRRAGNGILRILVEADRHVSLGTLLRRALELFSPFAGERDPQAVEEELREFFRQRLDTFLDERGIRYDLADATVHGSMDDPADVRHRAEALAAYSTSPDFAPLVLGYKRVANILRGQGGALPPEIPPLRPDMFSEPAERTLHEAAVAAAGRIRDLRSARRFGDALAELLALRAPIDRFFDQVMVMVDDPAVRGQRLALLAEVRELFTGTWDLSRVVVEGERSR